MRDTSVVPTQVLQELYNQLAMDNQSPQAQRSLVNILAGRRHQQRAEQTLLAVLRDNHIAIPDYYQPERK